MLLYKRLSCVLGSPRDPDVLVGQGEIQQTTSDSLYQLDFSTLFSFLRVSDLILGSRSFFSRYMNVLTQVTGHIRVTSQAVEKHLLQVTISLSSKFWFVSSPNHS